MYYINAWRIHTSSLRTIIAEELAKGNVSENDIVWAGPGGDAVVAATAADLDEEYAEYTDAGQVSEYLD